MRAGELNQRIMIMQPTEDSSSMGGVTTGHGLLRKVWAKVMQGLGKEFLAANAVEQRKAVFTIRWASDIAALGTALRVVWNGHVYEIGNVTGTRQSGELWLHGVSVGVAP